MSAGEGSYEWISIPGFTNSFKFLPETAAVVLPVLISTEPNITARAKSYTGKIVVTTEGISFEPEAIESLEPFANTQTDNKTALISAIKVFFIFIFLLLYVLFYCTVRTNRKAPSGLCPK